MKRIGVVLAAIVVAAASVVYVTSRGPQDDFPAGKPGAEVTIAVAEGQTLLEIGRALVDAGVIKSREAWLRAVDANPESRRIRPGGHRIDSAIPAAEAIIQLLDRSRITGLVTLFEGIRLAQVRDRLVSEGLAARDVDAALESVEAPFPKARSLEGFLLPGQYVLLPGTVAEDLIRSMVTRFESAATAIDLNAHAEALGVTPYQAVVIASLLQAEGHPEDYSKVLRVILNRLRIGMPLQLDATVLYALGRFGDVRVTTKDLAVDSPYNTYTRRGLPPGPINNPGREALEALGDPAVGDWLYYITVKPGDTRFTRSIDEFLEWKKEFRRNYEAGLFQ